MDPTEDSWLTFEDSSGKRAAEYSDFDEQVEMTVEDEAAHHEFVKRVAHRFGFPLSSWMPTLPQRAGRSNHES